MFNKLARQLDTLEVLCYNVVSAMPELNISLSRLPTNDLALCGIMDGAETTGSEPQSWTVCQNGLVRRGERRDRRFSRPFFIELS